MPISPPNNWCARFTTAMLNSHGYLDIIQWNLQPNGTISKLGEMIQDGGATAVSIASVYSGQNGKQQVVTAIHNFSGNLQVSRSHFDPVNGFGFSGTAYAGGITRSASPAHKTALVAVENGYGDLEVIQWFYSRSTLTRGNTAYRSKVAQSVAIVPGVPTLNNPPYFVDAFYTAAPNPYTTVTPWNQDLGRRGNRQQRPI